MRSKSALNYLIFGPDLPWNQSIADHFQVTQCYASSGWEFFPFPHKFLPQGLFFNTQSERKSPFLTGYTTLLAFWTKLHTLISHEECMLLGDGIVGMDNSLPCKLLSSSSPFGKNLSRQLGIASVVVSSVHLSWPQCCWQNWEDAVRRSSGRSLK